MEQFSEYSAAIVSLAVFAMLGLLLNPIGAALKSSEGITAGSMPEADYENRTYRINRAYLNAAEMAGFFAIVTVAAILAGASPFWVNLLATVFLLSRLVVAFIHIRGIGAENMGPRTMIFVVGWAACLILGLMAIVAAI